MSSDSRAALVQRRDEMLLLSERCFTSALGIEDGEAWLHHYILGKISEKLQKPPGIYLEHYQKSAKYLDDDISSYPRKISYYSPPDHSLEALEIYFRIHVSVLKLLFSKYPDVDVSVLEEHLQRALQGPFHHPEFDSDTGPGTVYRTESTTSESFLSSVFEDSKHGDTKTSESVSGADTVTLSEPTHKEDLSSSNAKSDVTETITYGAAETTESSKASSPAPIPMEVEISVPSDDVSSVEQTPDSSQAPSALVSEVKGLGTYQAATYDSKKNTAEEKCKENKEAKSSEPNELSENKFSKPSKEENSDANVSKLEETTLFPEEIEKSKTPEVEKRASDEKPHDTTKVLADSTDIEMATEEKDFKEQVDTKNEKMEIDAVSTATIENIKAGESTETPSNPATATADSESSPAQCPQAVRNKPLPLTAEQQVKKKELMDRCIYALGYCLRRFPQHHKSRYRLAYVYYYSPEHKETSASRDLLFGSSTRQIKKFNFPHQGVFNEKSKTNLFSAFWRIPEEDIDRPGCFCTHTYKSVALLLEVLCELNEWDTLILTHNLLYRTPEQGKKYLRDNERHYLARKAFEYSLKIIKARVSDQDPKAGTSALSQLVMDVYECWKTAQKYEPSVKVTEGLLTQAFEMFVASKSTSGESLELMADNSESSSSVLEQALKYCQQYVKPQTSSSNSSILNQPKGSSGTDTGTDLTSGSDTEAAPTTSEQMLSPQRTKNEQNSLVEVTKKEPAKNAEESLKDLPADSLSEEEPIDKTSTEDVPKVEEPLPSEEARVSQHSAGDSSTVVRESKTIVLVDKDTTSSPPERCQLSGE